MPDLTWWATVIGALASSAVLLGAIVTFWTEYGRKWFKRQFGIDEVTERLSDLEESVDSNTEQLGNLSKEHEDMAVMAIDAYETHNELTSVICEELGIDKDKLPQLNAEGVKESLYGDRPYSGDFTRGG